MAAPSEPLDCGNSGSTMRMLAGILAGQPFACEMTGDDSLRRRPMARIFEPLRQMGAAIEGVAGDRPPLRHWTSAGGGRPLRAIEYKLPVASAQVKSCVLFAGLLAQGTTSVEEPVPTRDHSELALGAFGATLERQGNRIRIEGGQRLRAIEASVPGDISSAAFFLCAAALFPGSNLVVDNLLLNPTRAAILDVLAQLGLEIHFVHVAETNGELAGSLQARGGKLKGCEIRGALTALLIDELPVLAAIAPYTGSGVVIADARELRVKESDRIAAIVSNLRAMGATVEETGRRHGHSRRAKPAWRHGELPRGSPHRHGIQRGRSARQRGNRHRGRRLCRCFLSRLLRNPGEAGAAVKRQSAVVVLKAQIHNQSPGKAACSRSATSNSQYRMENDRGCA